LKIPQAQHQASSAELRQQLSRDMDVDAALQAVETLHERLAALTREMERGDARHRALAQAMFDRGRALGRAELLGGAADASSSSTEWVRFLHGSVCAKSKVKVRDEIKNQAIGSVINL